MNNKKDFRREGIAKKTSEQLSDEIDADMEGPDGMTIDGSEEKLLEWVLEQSKLKSVPPSNAALRVQKGKKV